MSNNTITREDGFGAAVEFYQRMADDLRAQLAEGDARIAELEAALQLLCDLQNGPPLIRDTVAWHNAMEKAHLLLSTNSKGQTE